MTKQKSFGGRRFPLLIALLLCFFLSPVQAHADNFGEAENLTEDAVMVITGGGAAVSTLSDGKPGTFVSFVNDGEVTITAPEGKSISTLYIIWRTPPEQWFVDAQEKTYTGGEYGFLHETIRLDQPSSEAVLHWEDRQAYLADIHVFGEGTLPDWVQRWEPPEGPADLLLFPTHADDEHLYFGGTMPYYASRGDVIMQVCYMVNHNGEPYRLHEQLDGLWTAGVRRYPIIPEFPDIYSNSLEHAQTIYDKEEILAYQTEMIRRFQPMVIIGHDLKGEYGHGAHMLNAACLTALETAVKAFECHVSQQTYFQVAASGPYDCRKFGLYYTNVGLDEAGNDFFEHLELPRLPEGGGETETPEDVVSPEEILPEPEPAPEQPPEELASPESEAVPVTEPAQLPEMDRPAYALRTAAWIAGGASLALFIILLLVGKHQKNRARLTGGRR